MKAVLFMGILYSDEILLTEIIKRLSKRFGTIIAKSQSYDFNFTDYYEKEFGKNLKKMFIVFKNKIDREDLPKIKIFTNKLEKKFSKYGKRKINIDPGYLTMQNIILATTKEMPHRFYLSKNIFGEVTFVFKKSSCLTYHHTYPDFKTKGVQKFFLKIRKNMF